MLGSVAVLRQAVDAIAIQQPSGDLAAERLRAPAVIAKVEDQPLGVGHPAQHFIKGLRQRGIRESENVDVADTIVRAPPIQVMPGFRDLPNEAAQCCWIRVQRPKAIIAGDILAIDLNVNVQVFQVTEHFGEDRGQIVVRPGGFRTGAIGVAKLRPINLRLEDEHRIFPVETRSRLCRRPPRRSSYRAAWQRGAPGCGRS